MELYLFIYIWIKLRIVLHCILNKIYNTIYPSPWWHNGTQCTYVPPEGQKKGFFWPWISLFKLSFALFRIYLHTQTLDGGKFAYRKMAWIHRNIYFLVFIIHFPDQNDEKKTFFFRVSTPKLKFYAKIKHGERANTHVIATHRYARAIHK